MVVDTKGQHFVNREKTDKGKFAFTTDNYDVFEICFISRVPANMRGGRWDQLYDVTFIPIWNNKRQTNSAHNVIVSRHEIFLATKHGVEAKNYEGLGDAAKLKPLEVIHMSHKCFQTASPNLSKLGRHCPAYMLVLWRLNMFSSRSNWRDSRICRSPLFRTLLTWGKERFVIDVLKSEII